MAPKPTPETSINNPLAAALAAPKPFTPSGMDVPPEVAAWIDAGHAYWTDRPKEWSYVDLADMATADTVIGQGRAYAKTRPQGEVSLVLRSNPEVVEDGEGNKIVRVVYRVRDKVQSGRKPANHNTEGK